MNVSRHAIGLLGPLLLAAAAGCDGGPGWARVEPVTAPSLTNSVVFGQISAVALGKQERYQPMRPLMIRGSGEQQSARGQSVRKWELLALAEPADMPGRIQVIALLKQIDRRGRPTVQLYAGRQDLESWRYARRFMIHGRVEAAGETQAGFSAEQSFSACLKPGASRQDFREDAGVLLAALEKIRSAAKANLTLGDDSFSLDESIGRLRKMTGGKPAKPVKSARPAKPAPPPPRRSPTTAANK